MLFLRSSRIFPVKTNKHTGSFYVDFLLPAAVRELGKVRACISEKFAPPPVYRGNTSPEEPVFLFFRWDCEEHGQR